MASLELWERWRRHRPHVRIGRISGLFYVVLVGLLIDLSVSVAFFVSATVPADASPSQWSFEKDLKSQLKPWHVVRAALIASGCHHLQYTRTPAQDLQDNSDGPPFFSKQSSSASVASRYPALCRRPLVFFSGRDRNCGSCQQLTRELIGEYRAEWDLLRSYVTLVDGGDPLTDTLMRWPFPLPYNEAAAAALTNLSLPDLPEGDDMLLEWKEEVSLAEATLHQHATKLLQLPPSLLTHRWSQLIRHTYAAQSEYMMRVVFLYPHNGSLMQDVANDDLLSGKSSALHFYYTAPSLLDSIAKSLRVMKRLTTQGDY